jgi:glutamate N-acetyltransferase/amino-acid N-acetyltransferase
MIDVDGDTSPSDTVCVLANGLAGNRPLRASSEETSVFAEGLNYVCRVLAKEMVRDGEGATKVVEVRVTGAVDDAEARVAARAIASSNLVKAAAHGSDPNWGRILCAAGYSGAQVDQMRADISVGDVALMVGGEIAGFDSKVASAALQGNEVVVKVDLHLGNGQATAWGSDLTEEYVRFNAKYST